MKRLNVVVSYVYDIEIDENSPIVKEYKDTKELINDLASYQFDILPVINNGVRIIDVELQDVDIMGKV